MQRLQKPTPEDLERSQNAYRKWWENNGYKWGIWLDGDDTPSTARLFAISNTVVNMLKYPLSNSWKPSFDTSDYPGFADNLLIPTGCRDFWHKDFISVVDLNGLFRTNLQQWLHTCIHMPNWKGCSLFHKFYTDFCDAELKVNDNFMWSLCKFFDVNDPYFNHQKLLACLSGDRGSYIPAAYDKISSKFPCNDAMFYRSPSDETGCCIAHRGDLDNNVIVFGQLGFDEYIAHPYFTKIVNGLRKTTRQIKGFSTLTNKLVETFYAPLDDTVNIHGLDEMLLDGTEEWWSAKNDLESIHETWTFGQRHISKLHNRVFIKHDNRHVSLIHPMTARFTAGASGAHERNLFVIPSFIGDAEILNPWYENEVDWSQLIISNLSDSTRQEVLTTLKHMKNFMYYVDSLAGDECTGAICRTDLFDWVYLLPEPLYDAIFADDRGCDDTLFPCHDIKHGTKTMWFSYADRFEGTMDVTCDFCMESKPGLMTRMFAALNRHSKCDFTSLRDGILMTVSQLNTDDLVRCKTTLGCIDYSQCDHLYCNTEMNPDIGVLALSRDNHLRCCFNCMPLRFNFCHQITATDESEFGFGLWHLRDVGARTTKSASKAVIVID